MHLLIRDGLNISNSVHLLVRVLLICFVRPLCFFLHLGVISNLIPHTNNSIRDNFRPSHKLLCKTRHPNWLKGCVRR